MNILRISSARPRVHHIPGIFVFFLYVNTERIQQTGGLALACSPMRLAWLEDYAASLVEHADTPAPDRLVDGICLEHVSFAYPGTARRVLEDVNLDLKQGSVVAIVGENGAGKSTLVKLLARLYQPDQGRILVDGVDLARVPVEDWRAHVSGAFQDFFRFEFRARHTVGLGDVPRLDDEAAFVAAVNRAGADDVVARLAAGLDTQLGPTWPSGVEVSFGQGTSKTTSKADSNP